MERPSQFVVRHETPPERCEICHQADQFDPETGVCRRCQNLPVEFAPASAGVPTLDWTGAGIPVELQTQLQAELGTDEQLLWVGRPQLQIKDYQGGVALLAVGLITFWLVIVFTPKTVVGLLVMMLAFLAGFIGTVSFWSKFKSRKAVYAVSNQRAIILLPGRTSEISSIVGLQMTSLEARPQPDGTGDLYLTSKGSNNFFYCIQKVNLVEQIIRANLLKSER